MHVTLIYWSRSHTTRYRVMIPAVHRCKLVPGPACPAELIAIGDQEPAPEGNHSHTTVPPPGYNPSYVIQHSLTHTHTHMN